MSANRHIHIHTPLAGCVDRCLFFLLEKVGVGERTLTTQPLVRTRNTKEQKRRCAGRHIEPEQLWNIDIRGFFIENDGFRNNLILGRDVANRRNVRRRKVQMQIITIPRDGIECVCIKLEKQRFELLNLEIVSECRLGPSNFK